MLIALKIMTTVMALGSVAMSAYSFYSVFNSRDKDVFAMGFIVFLTTLGVSVIALSFVW